VVLARKEIRTAVDIGSGTVRAVIAERKPSGATVVLGIGTSASAGLRKGMVVDIEAVGVAMANAVAEAEAASSMAVQSVVVGVSGSHLLSEPVTGRVAITPPDREITEDDVTQALESCRRAAEAPEREIVAVVPREYGVDSQFGILGPVGMTGSVLEVDAQVVTGSSTALQNLRRSASRANLDVDRMVLESVAAARAALMPEELEAGVVLVDIGYATTDIAVFRGGSLLHAGVVPIGGSHVTNDIAVVLKVPVAYAEDLKIKSGAAWAEGVSDEEKCGFDKSISRLTLCQIIEARLDQVFEKVRENLIQSGVRGPYPGGVVLTGGTAAFRNITDVATRALDMPARVGKTERVHADEETASSPAFAVCMGLALCAFDDSGQQVRRGSRGILRNSFVESVMEWFRDVFTS
jgi:cell division protein FtsA